MSVFYYFFEGSKNYNGVRYCICSSRLCDFSVIIILFISLSPLQKSDNLPFSLNGFLCCGYIQTNIGLEWTLSRVLILTE